MRASKRARNQRADVARSLPTTVSINLPNDMKADIAKAVRAFTFSQLGGTCAARALVGNRLLREYGFDAHLKPGSMLFRAGPDPMADVVAYAGVYNVGRVTDGGMTGHIWNELDGEIIDFSCGDWRHEHDMMVRLYPDGLPLVAWQVEAPEYLWQPAAPLKAAWQRIGQPALGEFWYGPWAESQQPDYTDVQWVVTTAMGAVRHEAERLRLSERVAGLTMQVLTD